MSEANCTERAFLPMARQCGCGGPGRRNSLRSLFALPPYDMTLVHAKSVGVSHCLLRSSARHHGHAPIVAGSEAAETIECRAFAPIDQLNPKPAGKSGILR